MLCWSSCWWWWTSGFTLQLSKHARPFAPHSAAQIWFVVGMMGNPPASRVAACTYGSSSNVSLAPGLRQMTVRGGSCYGLLGPPLLGRPGTQLGGTRGSGTSLGNRRYLKNGSAERTPLNGTWGGKTCRAFWHGENAKCSPRWMGAGKLIIVTKWQTIVQGED